MSTTTDHLKNYGKIRRQMDKKQKASKSALLLTVNLLLFRDPGCKMLGFAMTGLASLCEQYINHRCGSFWIVQVPLNEMFFIC